MPRRSEASQGTSQPGARSLFFAQTENRATRGRFTRIVVKCCTNDTGRVLYLLQSPSLQTVPGACTLVYTSSLGSSMRWQNLFISRLARAYFPGRVSATRTLHHSPWRCSTRTCQTRGRPAASNMHRLYHAPAGQALAFWWEIGYTGCVIANG